MEITATADLTQYVGVYFFKSPYHKNLTYLPFVINAVSSWNTDSPFEVMTVEYKGWDREEITSSYTESSVLELINTRFIIPVKEVPVSKVPKEYKHLLQKTT